MNKYLVERGKALFHNAEQRVYKFPNGYGASVLKGGMAYGREDAPYELAVIKFDPYSGVFNLCYDTPITDNVVCSQTEAQIVELLYRIKNL